MFRTAQPIWFENESRPDTYLEAAASLTLSGTEPVTLRIAADSDYTVSINGRLAAFGQMANYPFRRVFDEVDVTAYLLPGENEVRVLA